MPAPPALGGARPSGRRDGLRRRRNGVSNTDAKTRANTIVSGSTRASETRKAGTPCGDPAGHDPLADDRDDRGVGQVQAVRGRAEAADRPRVEHAQKRSRTAGGQTGQQARDRRAQREVDPEQVVERPHRALPPDRREHGRGGGEREPGPRPRPASRARADDAGGQDADREQRGEVGRQTGSRTCPGAGRAGRRSRPPPRRA